MTMHCDDCPLDKFIGQKFEDQDDQILAWHVSQGLSARFVQAVRGTKGLTDDRVEEINTKEIKNWRRQDGEEEATILEDNPELSKSVYSCEEKITIMGSCARFSVKTI